jgi:iron(III) transport system permease protein
MVPQRSFGVATIGTFMVVAILPLAYMLLTPLIDRPEGLTIGNIFEIRHLSLAYNSLVMAAGTSLAALILGTGLAFFICRTDIPGRQWLDYMFIVPLLIPPYIHAIVWTHLSGFIQSYSGIDIHSLGGGIFILTLAYFPFVTMTTMAGLKSIDRSKEEAALMVYGPATMLRSITLPLCLPNMFCGAVFVFVFAIIDVSVPDILRVRVYPLEIFIQFSAFFDTWKATILSLPIVAITVVLIFIQRWTMGERSYVHVGGGEKEAICFELGRWRLFCGVLCACFVGMAVAVPIVTLLFKAGGIETYIKVLHSSLKPILSSFWVALVASILTTILGGGLGYLLQRSDDGTRRCIALLTIIPFAVPPTTMGIGLIGVWNRGAVGWVYGSMAIMVIAHMARFTPYAATIATTGVGQVSARLEEAARLAGAGFYSVLVTIVARLTRRHLVVSGFIVFILAFGELGTTLLVSPPGVETVPVKIYNLMHYGAEAMVSALCIILLTIIFIISSIFLWILRR